MRPELDRVRAAYVERRTKEIAEKQGVTLEQAKTMIEVGDGQPVPDGRLADPRAQ